MLSQKISLTKFIIGFLTFALGLVLCVKALGLAILPSLHVDESYYIGAARAILSGDLLLTGFSFDKLFLQPFVVASGILLLGQSVLGFRIVGVLLMLATFVIFRRGLVQIWVEMRTGGRAVPVSPLESFITTVGALGFSFLFLAQPIVLQHEASAMTEPALVFFLIFAFFKAVKSEKPLAWAPYWTLAAFAKMSVVLWLPFFVLSEVLLRGMKPRDLLKQFILRTRWLWTIAILFQLFNRKKFTAFSWFSHLGQSQNHTTSLIERSKFWLETLNEQTLFLGSFVLVVTVVVSILVIQKRRRKQILSKAETWALVASLGALAHAAGLPFSGAPLYERYLIPLYPLLILSLITIYRVAVVGSRTLSGRARAVSHAAVVVLVFGLGAKSISVAGLPLEPDQQRGRILEIVSQILPKSAKVASPLLWELYPYESSSWIHEMCVEPRCLWEQRAGLTEVLGTVLKSNDGRIEFFREPFVLSKRIANCKLETEVIQVVGLKANLSRRILSELRIERSASLQNLTIEPQDSSSALSQVDEALHVDASDAGFFSTSPTNLLGGVPAKFKVIESKYELEVGGFFQLIPSFDKSRYESDPGLVFVITAAKVVRPYQIDATDILPLIWKKRVLHIGRIDLSRIESNTFYSLLGMSAAAGGTIRLAAQNCR